MSASNIHTGFSIRPLQPADMDEWVRMRLAFWPDSQPSEAQAMALKIGGRFAVFVAVQTTGQLSGFVEVGLREFADGCSSSPVAFLEGIWVDPEFRRGSIARELFAKTQEWATSLGLSEMASDTAIENVDGQSFHLAFGFTVTGRNITYMLELDTTEEPPV